MTSIDSPALRASARRAYELARLKLGTRMALLVVPMIALSFAIGTQPLLSMLAGLTLLALVVSFTWQGQVLGRAVLPGLAAGCAPLLLPLVMRQGGACCIGGVCCSMCLLGCVIGGAIAGASIGIAANAEREQRWSFLSAASLISGAAGVLGCALIGAAGIAAMALSVVVASLPVAVIARVRGV